MAFESYGEPIENIDGRTEYKYVSPTDLVARMIYSEAMAESYSGKVGCYWTYANRMILSIDEFGHSTYDIITNSGYDGMKTSFAHSPDRSSQAWYDSCYIAATGPSSNPIGHCLWFNKNLFFHNHSYTVDGITYYKFPGTPSFQKVVEKVVVGNHTFFRVEGSKYIKEYN